MCGKGPTSDTSITAAHSLIKDSKTFYAAWQSSIGTPHHGLHIGPHHAAVFFKVSNPCFGHSLCRSTHYVLSSQKFKQGYTERAIMLLKRNSCRRPPSYVGCGRESELLACYSDSWDVSAGEVWRSIGRGHHGNRTRSSLGLTKSFRLPLNNLLVYRVVRQGNGTHTNWDHIPRQH